MKTPTDPVRDYLAAVEREVSTLPAERRQELLADLAEHIAVTRAEQPGATDGEVLAELGDPRVIAATALAEAGGGTAAAWGRPPEEPARRGRVHPLVPLLLLTVPFLFGTLSGSLLTDSSAPQLVVGLVRIVGAVLLCTSAFWTPVQKVVGVVLTIVLSSVANLLWEETTIAPAGDAPALVANLVTLVVLIGSAAWLWLVRRRV